MFRKNDIIYSEIDLLESKNDNKYKSWDHILSMSYLFIYLSTSLEMTKVKLTFE